MSFLPIGLFPRLIALVHHQPRIKVHSVWKTGLVGFFGEVGVGENEEEEERKRERRKREEKKREEKIEKRR